MAYITLGHPRSAVQEVEESMRYANSLGVRVTLSDFSGKNFGKCYAGRCGDRILIRRLL